MNAHVITPTPDLAESLAFYRKLRFTVVSETAPTLVTDSQVLIEIDPDRFARAGMKCFGTDRSKALDKLSGTTAVHGIDGGHLLSDPSGVRVLLMDGDSTVVDVPGATSSIVGTFAGLSIESTDMERSVAFWSALGYSVAMGAPDQGWVSLGADGCPGISIMKSLMCPHLFFNPSLTYFNGNEGNPVVIDNVRKAGVPITEKITHFNKEGIVDNIIIRDPGGLGFFLFND